MCPKPLMAACAACAAVQTDFRIDLASPRRLFTAVAIVALLGIGSLGVTGMASAEGGGGIATPERHAGDQVGYQVGAGSDWAWHNVTQLPLHAWKDSEGLQHPADPIERADDASSTGGDAPPIVFHSLLHAETFSPLAAASGGSASSSSSWEPLTGDEESESVVTARFEEGRSGHPCGWVHSLQGADGADRLVAFGDCRVTDGPVSLSREGTATWQGQDVAVFAGHGIELWIQSSIPYPVRVIVQANQHLVLDLQMATFARGADPLEPIDVPPDTPLPPVDPSPMHAGLPDMAGLDLPYPLETAIEAAKEDPAFSDLRDWLADHPEAVVTVAEHEGDEQRQRWSIVWQDATAHLDLSVSRSHSGESEWLHSLGVDHETRWRVTHHASPGQDGWDVPPEGWNDMVPRLRDVVDAWKIYSETDAEPRFLGFRAPHCDDCPLEVYAGAVGATNHDGSGGPLGLFEEPVEEVSQGFTLHYDGQGQITSIEHATRTYQRSGGPLASPSTQPSEVSPPAARGMTWVPPPEEAAAGIGALALLAGLLYWLWPTLKVAPFFGLRWGRRPRALDHPVRRSLHGIVAGEPGIHYQAVVQKVGLGHGAVEHHLRRLVADGEIVVVRSDGYTCYFPKGVDHRAARTAGVLKSAGARKVFAAVQETPGAAVTDIAKSTGLSPGTVSHHLKRLRERGVVESWRDGRTVRLRAGAVVALLP